MHAGRLAALAAALAAGACQPREDTIELNAPDDSVLVLAWGTRTEAQAIVMPPGRRIPHTLGADIPIVLFEIARGDLVGPDGEPLPDERRRSFRLRANGESKLEDAAGRPIAPDGAGSCGRCLLPESEGDPQVVLDGSRCPLPGTAAARSFVESEPPPSAETVAALRAAVELEWPGRCACDPAEAGKAPAELAEAGGFELEQVRPVLGAAPLQAVAIDEEGTAGLFSEQLSAVVSSAGERTEIGCFAGRGRCEPEEGPFAAGPVQVAAPIPTGGFLVASTDTHRNHAVLARVDAADGRVVASASGGIDGVRPSAVLQLGDGPAARVALVGRKIVDPLGAVRPMISSCDTSAPNEPPACREIVPETLFSIDVGALSFVAAGELDDGSIVAAIEPWPSLAVGVPFDEARPECGDLAPERDPSTGATRYWHWRLIDLVAAWPAGTGVQPSWLVSAAAVGQRAVLCMRAVDTPTGDIVSAVLTATLAPSACLRETPSLQWRATVLRGQHCTSVVRSPEGEAWIRAGVSKASGEIRRVVVTSSVSLEPVTDPLAAVGDQTLDFAPSAPGWFGAIGGGGAVYRWRTGAGPPVRVHGAPLARSGRIWLPVARGPDVWILRGGVPSALAVRPARGGAASTTTVALALDAPAVWPEEVTALVHDSASGDVVVAGSISGLPQLLRVNADGRVRSIDVRGKIGALVESMTETAPGRILLVTSGGTIVRLTGDSLSAPLEVEWDDPRTSIIEEAPADCPYWRGWRADAASGVGWIVGCALHAIRVSPVSSRRIGFDRSGELGRVNTRKPITLSTVRAFCPDRVLVGGDPINDESPSQLRGQIWQLAGDPATRALTVRSWAQAGQDPPAARLESPTVMAGGAEAPLVLAHPIAGRILGRSITGEPTSLVHRSGAGRRIGVPGLVTGGAAVPGAVVLTTEGPEAIVTVVHSKE